MTEGSRPALHIVAGILRRADQIVMVRQAAPGQEPFWSLPSGQLEDGELLNEALAREIREETGLEIAEPPRRVPGLSQAPYRLVFVVQIDNRKAEQLHQSRGPGSGYLATVWTFEVESWNGVLRPSDPDGFVLEASLVDVADAISRLEANPWQSSTVRYLRGDVASGSLILERWHADGRVEIVGR